MKLVECVPNFSEGRDEAKIKSIITAIEAVNGVTVLDVNSGSDTNRTVVTFVGQPDNVAEGAFQGIKKASKVIDMSKQTGTHPRIGATDVCPFIPVSQVTDEECIELSKKVGRRVGEELEIPVYLYEKSAQNEDRIKLPDIRKGEYEGLTEKLRDQQWKPDFGPTKFNLRAGATVMGCREFLIAYNINLNTKDHRLAMDIAFELREAGRSKRTPNPDSKNLLDGEIVRHQDGKPVKVSGLFKDVKGIGWYVDAFKRAQISINFNNYKVSTIHEVYDAACKLAEERGIRVTGSELVGLIPLEAMLMAGKHYLKKQNRSVGVPTADIIECAIQSLGLNDVTSFDPQEKIIDYAVKSEYRPLIGMTGQGFVEELSTNSPAPGGGSVAALAGSLAAALSSMVAALTHEKKDMLGKKPAMDEIGIEAQALKDRLSFLVDEDTIAFNKVMDANRMPETSKLEEEAKATALEEANKYAIEIPFETVEKCYRVMELAEMLVKEGNPNSVSDAGVAAEVALAGVRGAAMNVLINLSGINDASFWRKTRKAVEDLIQKAEVKHRKVFKDTLKVIDT